MSVEAEAQLNVRLVKQADMDKLEDWRRKKGCRTISEMIRADYGLTPWPDADASPKRGTRKKVA